MNLYWKTLTERNNDYYEIENLSFRPELEFENNEQRGSEEFTIKKKPTINFRFQNIEYKDIKNRLEIICHFLSFLYGVRIVIDKLVYRTEKEIYFFRNTEPNNKTYVSDLFSISGFLKNNCRIEKILKTNWFENYLQKEKQITPPIKPCPKKHYQTAPKPQQPPYYDPQHPSLFCFTQTIQYGIAVYRHRRV